MSDLISTKQERVKKVNELVKVIGDGGRNFFRKIDKETQQVTYANIEVDPLGKVWWNDDYSKKRIYTHSPYRWRGFTNGGTLKCLVEAFRDYVRTGEFVPGYHFGPWPQHYCDGDVWGYGEYMDVVRQKAQEIGLTSPLKVE